jgi:transcriptional regulator of acetoin/glycerol metabolism
MNAPETSLFFNSRTERLALARQRYFEEGLLPSGIVSDAVYQSWARCQRLHDSPGAKVSFQPVSTSRAHLALQKNRDLVHAWLEELPQLQSVLGATSCAAMLIDATGVLIGATCVGRSHERIMPIATRTGVNLCEEAVGTTAPGVAARTGRAVSVDGAEHFFDEVKAMHCAAAPIHDTRGRLAGVLDISSEAIPFSFDAASVVGLYAAAIENQLFISQSNQHLVVRFQVDAMLLDSRFVALVGIDIDGCLAWMNGAAARLLGLPPAERGTNTYGVEEALGASIAQLASLPLSGSAPLQLANGLLVWARGEMRAADGHRDLVPGAEGLGEHVAPVDAHAAETSARTIAPPGDEELAAKAVTASAIDAPAAAPTAQAVHAIPAEPSPERLLDAGERSLRLRECGNDLIDRTLEIHGGNVTKTAEKLGVSRGLIYRRLRGRVQAGR